MRDAELRPSSGRFRRAIGSYVFKGSAYSVSSQILSMGTGIVSLPLLLNYLGRQEYGIWALTFSTLSFTSFLDFGITPKLKNKLAAAFAADNHDALRYYTIGSLRVAVALVMFGAVLSVIAYFLNWQAIFGARPGVGGKELSLFVSCALFVLMISLALTLIEAVFAAQLKIDVPKKYSIAGSVVGLIFLILAILLRVSLPLLCLFYYLPALAMRSTLIIKIYPPGGLGGVSSLSELRVLVAELLNDSMKFVGIQFSAVVLGAAPNLFVARYLSLSDVATFSVAYKFVTIPLVLLSSVLPVFWPRFTVAWEKREYNWFEKRFRRVVLLTNASIIPCAGLFFAFGNEIVKMWTGGTLNIPSSLLLVLSGWVLVQANVYWFSTFLHSISDFTYELIYYLATSILLVGSLLFFVPAYGLFGVVGGMLVSLIVGSLVPFMARVRRRVNEMPKSFHLAA